MGQLKTPGQWALLHANGMTWTDIVAGIREEAIEGGFGDDEDGCPGPREGDCAHPDVDLDACVCTCRKCYGDKPDRTIPGCICPRCTCCRSADG